MRIDLMDQSETVTGFCLACKSYDIHRFGEGFYCSACGAIMEMKLTITLEKTEWPKLEIKDGEETG